ncbi:prepilin-type N-terminal cleavage/methylation domain-containing protein [Massilia sp. H6]|uniref:prepilin-type N-terminal cleavage/methylation domain-containing protein n=1 Tax=Massilia sp. H6 TaxID=2970464 RepID=UPI002168CAF1|nr:prepilin-type N-terminal cleavage/methylation domain-containing protein [Massilia sp. H6]UVW28727.1 prepilin-type N-terminal cleavage/methylation domain-containing protein [Massilia sp. H6]
MKTTFFQRAAAKGFTLIELLIVVIIIAILAAIAIPQFSNTSGDAQEAALDANLNTVRSAIELYRVQHRNSYPTVTSAAPVAASASACTTAGGVAGTGAKDSALAFKEQLTMFSDASGGTCTVAAPTAGITLGPYLRAIPQEQLSNPPTDAVAIVITGVQNPVPANSTTGGYQFDNRGGQFVKNSNAMGRRGQEYYKY